MREVFGSTGWVLVQDARRMGYDTTLHLVHDRALPTIDSYFFNPHPDDQNVPMITRLLRDEPSNPEGPGMFAQWLVYQVSYYAPYVRARNVALSLWDREATGDFPTELIGSIVHELPRIRAEFPALVIPRRFDGNYSPGIYVCPADVREVSALVDAAPPHDHLEGLRRVLGVAVERGLGYWEATEVGVAASPKRGEWL